MIFKLSYLIVYAAVLSAAAIQYSDIKDSVAKEKAKQSVITKKPL